MMRLNNWESLYLAGVIEPYSMIRIPFQELQQTIEKAFLQAGLSSDFAATCARIHAETSQDGVYSHGLNRVEKFVEYVHQGWVNPSAKPSLAFQVGNLQIYDGQIGPGITNALFAMDRAMDLAREMGLGLVTLRNTTHWMRGGSYGWYAAEKGFMSICWTNTESCMPAWGAQSAGIGNNPFVMSIPREEGHVVLDMAMSQYSYGKLEITRLKGEELPYPGGFNMAGELTSVPAEIEESRRILPTGYWKGSSLAIMLDLFAGILSQGNTTASVDTAGFGNCGACSQVFIAIDPLKITNQVCIDQALAATIDQIHHSQPVENGVKIQYPGERSLQTRKENQILGVPVHESVWERVKVLAGL
jgi:3-dehydro-L-gulonate 2-dehydrogenase